MGTEDNFKRVYTGPEVNVQYLQDLFQQAQIPSRVRNDFDSGLRAGFGGGLPGQVQIFVPSQQASQAEKIVQDTFPEEETE